MMNWKNRFLRFSHLLLAGGMMLFLTEQARADDYTLLYIWSIEGEKTVVELAGRPVISVSNDSVYVRTDKAAMGWSVYEVQRFSYGPRANDAIHAATKGGEADIRMEGNRLNIRGCRKGDVVTIYGCDGRVMTSRKLKDEENVNMSLDALPTGLYIVKKNGVTLKFRKR